MLRCGVRSFPGRAPVWSLPGFAFGALQFAFISQRRVGVQQGQARPTTEKKEGATQSACVAAKAQQEKRG